MKAIVLFAGPGGASLGIRRVGLETVGVEVDDDAVRTSRAAGLDVVQGDINLISPLRFCAEHAPRDFLLQASPPCPSFSIAGGGPGSPDLTLLQAATRELARHAPGVTPDELSSLCRLELLDVELQEADERSHLTFSVVRWIIETRPSYVMLEQVPPVLVFWRTVAELLGALGYSTWVGNVNAEQFGVSQARRRAVLIASRVSTVHPPEPTHSKYHPGDPYRMDPGVKPWVSMGEALRLDDDRLQRSNYSGPPKGGRMTAAERGRTERSLDQPSVTLTGRPPRWVTRDGEGRELVERVSPHEAGGLQSFPLDYPWYGNRTSVYQQAGNAVPPLLQEVLTAQLLGS